MVAVPSIGRASLVEQPLVAPEASATQGLYERHAAKILAYCQHQLGSREEAEDAVQTTFMNAFRALGKGVVPEAETAWLFKIAENVCLSRRRSSWRRNRIESPADFEVIEEVVAGPSRQRDELIGIEDALASMPEQQRRAILLREWQGLSYREIADELELSQSAVETLIFRARRSLAQGLTEPTKVKPRRRSLRRALHLADLTTLAAAAKSLLAGSAAVKATTAAVAVTAIAGGAATVGPQLQQREPAPKVAPAARAVVAPPAEAASAAPRSASDSTGAAPTDTARRAERRAQPAARATPRTAPGRAPVPVAAAAGGAPSGGVPAAAPETDSAPAAPADPGTERATPAHEPKPAAPAVAQERDEPRQEPKEKEKARETGAVEATESPRTPGAAHPSGKAPGKKDDAAAASAPADLEGGDAKGNEKEKGRGTDASAPAVTPVADGTQPAAAPAPAAEDKGDQGHARSGKDK